MIRKIINFNIQSFYLDEKSLKINLYLIIIKFFKLKRRLEHIIIFYLKVLNTGVILLMNIYLMYIIEIKTKKKSIILNKNNKYYYILLF